MFIHTDISFTCQYNWMVYVFCLTKALHVFLRSGQVLEETKLWEKVVWQYCTQGHPQDYQSKM